MLNRPKIIKIKLSDIFILVFLVITLTISALNLFSIAFKTTNIVYKVKDYREMLTNSGNAPFKKLIEFGFERAENNLPQSVKNSVMSGQILDKDGYLSFKNDSKTYIFIENTLYEIDKNASIKDDKYVYNDIETGKKGIKNIFGEVVFPANFDTIYFASNTMIATQNGTNFVYYNNEMVFKTEKSVFICRDSNFIGVESEMSTLYYDLSGDFSIENPCTLDVLKNYPNYILLENFGNIFSIYDTESDLIGFAINSAILIEPMFKTINFDGKIGNGQAYFNGNYINYYLKYENDSFSRMSLNNFGLENAQIFNFNDGYAVFYDKNIKLYGVIDEKFNVIIQPIFHEIDKIIVNGYILDTKTNAYYSINKREYVVFGESLTRFDDFSIVKKEKSYQILNKTLDVMIECDYAFYSQKTNTLFVIYNSSIYQFKK